MMDNVTYPQLRTVSWVDIDPTAVTQMDYVSQNPYLIIDMDVPEVSPVKVKPIFTANTTEYEKAVAKFFAGDFLFDKSKLFPAGERRTIFYLDKLAGVIEGEAGKYTMTLTILEFKQ